MIPLQQAILHFPGIGTAKAKWLHDAGIVCWNDFLTHEPPDSLKKQWPGLQEFAEQNIQAEKNNDIQFFIDRLEVQDRWRLLQRFWNLCHFIDIETSGMDCDAHITVISVWNGQELKLFLNGENLDDFPEYALAIPFAVTFNGSTFDVPVIKRYFNLPDFPVPHVDLRWVCNRCNLSGGLKAIERQLDVKRPQDVDGTDGMDAIVLWNDWNNTKNTDAKAHLLRYCAADTIALQHVTAKVINHQASDAWRVHANVTNAWDCLQKTVPPPETTFTSTTNKPHIQDNLRHTEVQMAATDLKPETLGANQLSELQHRLKAFLNRKRAH